MKSRCKRVKNENFIKERNVIDSPRLQIYYENTEMRKQHEQI